MTGPEAKGLRHIAFTVENLDQIAELFDCEEIRTDWFGRRFIFTKDLDGQPIELKERNSRIDYNPEDSWVQKYKEQFGTGPSFS